MIIIISCAACQIRIDRSALSGKGFQICLIRSKMYYRCRFTSCIFAVPCEIQLCLICSRRNGNLRKVSSSFLPLILPCAPGLCRSGLTGIIIMICRCKCCRTRCKYSGDSECSDYSDIIFSFQTLTVFQTASFFFFFSFSSRRFTGASRSSDDSAEYNTEKQAVQ